jgi:hypothetical protein
MNDSRPAATVAAEAAAEAVRTLNHATLDPRDVDIPTVYAVLGELTRTVYGLSQAIGQIESAVAQRHIAGRLQSTGDAASDVATIVGQLGGSMQLAADLASRIEHAHEAASRLIEH